jgi:hypothetical protein
MADYLNLTNPHHSYFFGFIQGDGHLYRQKDRPNKGRLIIELSLRDQDILHHFHDMFPESTMRYRTRDTNFKDDHESAIWSMCRQSFREEIESLGVPAGAKSLVVEPPKVPYCAVDYWRGLIDADGSLGVTGQNLPYISLVTSSEEMARAYEAFLSTITGKFKVTSRNTRDGVFNILVMREDAIKVIAALYYPDSLSLERKRASAQEACRWVRPSTMRQNPNNRAWTADEDRVVMTHTPKEAQVMLSRSKSSVSCRNIHQRQRPICRRCGLIVYS